MRHHQILLLAIIILASATTDAYQLYQTYIPNGDKVPNPCLAGTKWPGVGHSGPAGGGARNPFGLDFAAQQFNWTKVCPLDSDKDGRTNGQELGDPNCLWTTGMASPSSSSISHPGICEPLNSPNCSSPNSWLQCPAKFNCPAINNSDVRPLTLRFPQTPVPANDTTYMCFGFRLPNDTDYHVIATTPIINNSQVVHHMLLFVCKNEFTDLDLFQQPKECGMASTCNTLIGVWGVGATGQCTNDQFGFLIGASGYKYAVLQVHWNNPGRVSTFTDSSGMTLYYTPKLRPNSGAVLMAGQLSLQITPGLRSVSFNGTCPKYCTSALPQTLFITDVALHMHLLGASGDIQLLRNGKLNRTMIDVPEYEYDDPPHVQFASPVAFQPGDEIRVDCTYDSSQKTTMTHYGESTQDEMCFGFLTYYPINDNFTQCSQWRDVAVCSNVPINCRINDFTRLSMLAATLCTAGNCSRSCQLMMMALIDTGCMRGNIAMFLSSIGYAQEMMWLAQMAQQCGVMNPGGGAMEPTTPLPKSTGTAIASSAATVSIFATLTAASSYLLHRFSGQ